jgi:hypothetical protein
MRAAQALYAYDLDPVVTGECAQSSADHFDHDLTELLARNLGFIRPPLNQSPIRFRRGGA